MLVGGVLLLIDLFLPWQDFGNDFSDAAGTDASFSGWRGFGGVLVGLLTIILLAWLIVRLASVDIPLPVSTAMSAAVIGTLILIFTVIKLLTILGDEATIWAWVGLVLAIVIAVGAFRTVQEAGGVDTLRTEASNLSSSMGSSGANGALGSVSGTIYAPDDGALFADAVSGTATLAVITGCIYIDGSTSTFDFSPDQLYGNGVTLLSQSS